MNSRSEDPAAAAKSVRSSMIAAPPPGERHPGPRALDDLGRPPDGLPAVIGRPPPSVAAPTSELPLSSAVEHPADATPRPISPDECWEDDDEPPPDRPEHLTLDMAPDDYAPPRDADPPPSWYEPPDWEPRPDRPEDELWPEPSSAEAPRDPSAAAPSSSSSSPSQPMQIELPTHKEEYERKVREGLLDERAKREIRRRLDAEAMGATAIPDSVSLREMLAQPPAPVTFRIEGWQPSGTRALLAAQAKAGKTTFIDNLTRSLVDGGLFLGQAPVTPVDGRVALLDTEMNRSQRTEWLRAHQIVRDDRVQLVLLRGCVAAFNILDPVIRAEWAARLRDWGIKYLILDCLRPVLDALGLDENHDTGRFLVAFDALLKEADIPEGLIVQHMGHTNERSRGDSRLRDWPDVEWRLTRETDDPASPRSITAYGRDVEIPNTALVYDSGTRRLTLGGLVPDRAVVTQQKRNKMIEQALGVVVRWLYQGQHVDLSGRQIKEQMPDKGRPSVANIDAALKHGLQTGDLLSRDGPKGANLYRVAPESPIVREHEELQTFCKPKGTKA